MNYSRFVNLVSSSRKPSAIRVLTALKAQSGPSMISLAGGNPNPLLFPFKEATFKLRGGKTLHLSEDKMKVALQYDASPGNADLLKMLKRMQEHYHRPPLFNSPDETRSIDVCVTYGSTDGISKSFEMLLSPGDKVLVEELVSPTLLSALHPLGCEVFPIKMDDKGMVPESLQLFCQNIDHSSKGFKFLLTTPNAQIPTGTSTTSDRRKEIYRIASQFDFLILENDPFYMLQNEPKKPSYLSLDIDGRVLRFDSFSSTLSPGIRVGFVTGPKVLLNRIVLHLMSSSMHVSTLSQVLVSEYLKDVGLQGYEEHIKGLCQIHKSRRDAAVTSAEKWLKGFTKWNVPDAGTNLWLKINPKMNSKFKNYIQNHKFLVSGDKFAINSKDFDQNIMVSFAECSSQEIDEELQNMAEEWKYLS